MRPRAVLLDVRADELRPGDVLEEGLHVTWVRVEGRWVDLCSNVSSSREPRDRIVRVIRGATPSADTPEAGK